MTFPITKRINTDLLIDEREALCIQKGSLKNKGLSEEGKIIGANNSNRRE